MGKGKRARGCPSPSAAEMGKNASNASHASGRTKNEGATSEDATSDKQANKQALAIKSTGTTHCGYLRACSIKRQRGYEAGQLSTSGSFFKPRRSITKCAGNASLANFIVCQWEPPIATLPTKKTINYQRMET